MNDALARLMEGDPSISDLSCPILTPENTLVSALGGSKHLGRLTIGQVVRDAEWDKASVEAIGAAIAKSSVNELVLDYAGSWPYWADLLSHLQKRQWSVLDVSDLTNDEHVSALLRWLAQGHVQKMSLDNISSPGMEIDLSSAHIEELELVKNNPAFHATLMANLRRNPFLRRLTVASDTEWQSPALLDMISSSPSLRSLTFVAWGPSRTPLEPLADALSQSALTTLDFSWIQLADTDITSLARLLGGMWQLESFSLQFTEIGNARFGALATALAKHPHLQRLVLRRVEIRGQPGAMFMAEILSNVHLRELTLQSLHFAQEDESHAMMEALEQSQLNSIELRYCRFLDFSRVLPAVRRVERLAINEAYLRARGDLTAGLALCLPESQWKELDLSHNPLFGEETTHQLIQVIAKGLPLSRLERIAFGGNIIGARDVRVLFESIGRSPKMKNVNLKGTVLDSSSLSSLARCLAKCDSLEALELTLHEDGEFPQHWLSAFRSNTSLAKLVMDSEHGGPPPRGPHLQVFRCIERNRDLRRLMVEQNLPATTWPLVLAQQSTLEEKSWMYRTLRSQLARLIN